MEELKNRNIWGFETDEALEAPIDVRIKTNYLKRTEILSAKLDKIETKPIVEKGKIGTKMRLTNTKKTKNEEEGAAKHTA